jgi:3-oxoadipate enol-lactonase
VATIDVNGTALHVTDEGPAGDAHCGPFLMVHGLARSGWFWKDWVPLLSREHRVIRVDLRGCGRSSAPSGTGEFSFSDLAGDVQALIADLDLRDINYVGESTGGLVGTVIAAQDPERIATLTLVSTPTRPADGDPGTKSPGAATPEASLRELGLRQWWLRSRAMTADLFGDERDEEYAAEFARTPVPVAVAMWQAMHQPDVDLHRWAADVRARTLILTPGRSTSLSAGGQQELAGMIPGARLRSYPGWTHGMYFLHPHELAADTLTFVDGPDEQPRSEASTHDSEPAST